MLLSGNETAGEAAVNAGCRFYAGYPITPQNQLTEYMSRRLSEVGGTFIQAESEVAAINMVFGAAVAGARAMTFLLQSRHFPQTRRNLLSGRLRTACGHHQHEPRRARFRRCNTEPG